MGGGEALAQLPRQPVAALRQASLWVPAPCPLPGQPVCAPEGVGPGWEGRLESVLCAKQRSQGRAGQGTRRSEGAKGERGWGIGRGRGLESVEAGPSQSSLHSLRPPSSTVGEARGLFPASDPPFPPALCARLLTRGPGAQRCSATHPRSHSRSEQGHEQVARGQHLRAPTALPAFLPPPVWTTLGPAHRNPGSWLSSAGARSRRSLRLRLCVVWTGGLLSCSALGLGGQKP